MQQYLTRVREKKYLTQHVVELTVDLMLPDRISFVSGQYMQFMVESQQRAYSITNLPEQDGNKSLTFCIEVFDRGLGMDFVRGIEQGQEFYMKGPFGVFVFKTFNRPALFVATNVGIAPFVSMIPDILSQKYSQNAQLLFGVRHEENVFYFDKFRHMASTYHNFSFVPILSRPLSHWPGETGRVTTYLEVFYEQYRDHVIYISGGMEMVHDTRNLLLRKGHSPSDIFLEIFL